MKPHGQAIRLGLFTLLGLGLLVALIVAVFGAQVFAATEKAVLRFGHTVQGLQVGGPVVLRGVRVGTVKSIDIQTSPRTGRFEVPVVIEVQRRYFRALDVVPGDDDHRVGIAALVAHGLQGQLLLQSLLTGQLYIDLDLRTPTDGQALPEQPVRRSEDGLVEIPTRASKLQSLQSQLEGLDVGKLAGDVSALVSATRELIASPALKQTVADVGEAAAAIKRVSQQLDQRLGPLAQAAEGTLRSVRGAADRAGAATDRFARTAERISLAADRTGEAAQSLGAAGQRASAALAPESPLLSSFRSSAEELGRTARALERAVAEDAQTMQSIDATLRDLARASRAVRELTELVEQHPDALLRGRRTPTEGDHAPLER